MPFLLSLSRLIDIISTGVGKFSMWLILATTLISAGNAIVRKLFNVSSNGLLEIQWLSIVLSWPLFTNALASGEMSQNAGGLIRWPVYALIPLGFALLALQGVSELIKRIAFLAGLGPDVLSLEENKSDEEKHMEELEAIVARKLAEGK